MGQREGGQIDASDNASEWNRKVKAFSLKINFSCFVRDSGEKNVLLTTELKY